SYAQYSSTGSWYGTLGNIGWQKSYQIMVTAPAELQIVGQKLTDTLTLPVVDGWNWIGFPQGKINTVDGFMHSFASSNNDVLQSSTQFSTYASGAWNGSLQNMQPGRGYKLKAGATGNILVEPRSTPNWSPDVFGTEFNMNVTAVVKANGTELIGNFVVGAFINGTCVGLSAPQVAGGSPRVFLTLHGDVANNNQGLQFLIYDYATDSIYTPTYNPLFFVTDQQQGSIEDAFVLNLETPLAVRNVNRDGDFALHQNIPNPFNGNTMIRIDMPRQEQVTLQVFDYTGKLIAEPVNGTLTQGAHTIQFNPGTLSAGIYFYRMQAGEFTATKRMVIQ
ncbi:MAG: T9SS type A sorting domain-containing protein, partial [Chitinophagales bacterium]|nr:T9SS type A sorting domain-containing protein [Chitinophagales bacterium]